MTTSAAQGKTSSFFLMAMSLGRYSGLACWSRARVGGGFRHVLHVCVSSSTQNPSHDTPCPSERFVHVVDDEGQGVRDEKSQVDT